MASTLEREVKLAFDSPAAARSAVVATGATLVKPRRLQADALFDTDQRLLSARRQVLRVRVEEGRSFVTFKSPAEHPTMKLREELETHVGDGALLVAILERAGFRIWFRYEKYREEYTLGEAVVAIDETPIGTFVEIEGTDRGITQAAFGLDRHPHDYILESYRSLFVRYCQQRGQPAVDMVFERS
jgi:adenylate cyclase class 2